MSKAFLRERKKWETNLDPQLEVMLEGTPCFENTWRTNKRLSSGAVRVSWAGMKMACLESRSTITSMAVYPAESGRCSIRSIEIEFHGSSGIGSCLSVPYGRCLGTLERAQVVQDLQ